MRALAEIDTAIWRLAGASKYERNHLGTFAPSTPVSHHMFGWDRKQRALIVQDMLGMAGTATHTLHLPPELAELFLVRCLDQPFADRFLNSYCPQDEQKETLALVGHELMLSCTAYKSGSGLRGATLPTLSLSSSGDTGRLWLFYELRKSLGDRMKKLTQKEIHRNLQPQ